MSTTTISGLPTKIPTGAEYIPIEDSSSTGKATLNAAVAATDSVSLLSSRFTYKNGISANTLTAAGLYWCTSCTDVPYTDSWVIEVFSTGGSYVKQIASTTSTTGVRYERVCSNGTWAGWMLLFDRYNVATGTSKTVSLKPYGAYLVAAYNHLWHVQVGGDTSTPTVTSLVGSGTTVTCTGSSNASIELGNTSGYAWVFGITCLVG